MIERFHRSPGLSYYIDSANTNWDIAVLFHLMAYPATPNTTGFSPYNLFHGRKMALPNSENLKAKLSKQNENLDQNRRLENPKSSLRSAYQLVKKANSPI